MQPLKVRNIWIQENWAGFEFEYKSLNFPPSRSDYPWCNHEGELLYSFIFSNSISKLIFQVIYSINIKFTGMYKFKNWIEREVLY